LRYIVFGGKGGVGKTALSAACAFYLARQGKRALIFSVDPQASLSDIFQTDIFGKGPIEIVPNLYAQEIDAGRRVKEYQQEIRRKILDMYGTEKIPDEIESYIQDAEAKPAMEESAALDGVADIVGKGGYDYYIWDLVPLGHTLYYLSIASAYDAWINKVIGLRRQMGEYDRVAAVMRREKEPDEDAILKELLSIEERINNVSTILADKERTAFLLVVTPEQMVINDTAKAAGLLTKFDVPLAGYIVNRVLPEALKGQDMPECLKNRLTTEQHYLQIIRERFSGMVLAHVSEIARDVAGLAMIEKLAGAMF